ncbi:MAG TPA: indolepyruvate oxidoreductase subunit beta [Dehalococcoidia bacterium]|jgi:indolepyruvate ferredoxin oxidoreductase beta subunit|nr:indolepyruvate oxidoreductase subunit beta [Dehalococcoidia bacterium]
MAIQEDPMNLVISGVGGQGNILLSRLIGRSLVKKGYFVSIGETFGAAQRGGAVMSNVRVSEHMPLGPLIPEGKAHIILGLEPLETLRVLVKYGNPKVVTITNSQPLFPVDVLSRKAQYPDYEALKQTIRGLSQSAWFIDATAMGLGLGAPIVANVIMLGALIGIDLLPLTKGDIEAEIKASFPPDRAELNLKAFNMGTDSVG